MKLKDIIFNITKVKCNTDQFKVIHNILNQLGCKWQNMDHFGLIIEKTEGVCIYPNSFPNCITIFTSIDRFEAKNVYEYTFDEFMQQFNSFDIHTTNLTFTKLELENFSKFYNDNINSYNFEEAFKEFFKTN